MFDYLPANSPQAPSAPHPATTLAFDARRCTVQLENGHLYLDANAAPARVLLGYDAPRSLGLSPTTAIALIERIADGYRCVAVAANLDEAVAVATAIARKDHGEIDLRIVDGDGEEPVETREAVLIALENRSLGRSGRWLRSEGWSRKPDFVLVGDALTGGAPFAAVLARNPPSDRSAPLITCDAAALARAGATIQTVITENLLDQAPLLDRYFRERLDSVRDTCGEIGELDLFPLGATIRLSTPTVAARLKRKLCERGVLVGLDDQSRIVIAPPLVIRPAEIDVISGVLRAALMNRRWRPSLCCPDCQAIAAV